MADMKKKVLMPYAVDYMKIIRKCIQDDNLGTYTNGVSGGEFTVNSDYMADNSKFWNRAFLPICYPGDNKTGDIAIIMCESGSNCIYKINEPGFIYRSHFSGSWNSSSKLKLLVCADKDFNSGVYEYMVSEGTGGMSHNSHSLGIVPIRPGESTYLMVCCSAMQSGENVLFLPAYSSSDEMNKAVEMIGNVETKSIPKVKANGDPGDIGFIKIFE